MPKPLEYAVVGFGVLTLGYLGLGLYDRMSAETEGAAIIEEATQTAQATSSEGQSDAAATPALDGVDYGLEISISGQANGTVTLDLFEDVAPLHTAQLVTLAKNGAYDNVVFHRVIDGFMAQTGDVEFGQMTAEGFSMQMAGRGGSDLPNIPAEFSKVPFDEGIVGMARSQDPNSANSQFFIMFAEGHFLNEQYTVIGKVTGGMDVVHQIRRGDGPNGAVIGVPDVMTSVKVTMD